MAEFLNAVSAVFLLFSLMAVGYFLGVFGWMGQRGEEVSQPLCGEHRRALQLSGGSAEQFKARGPGPGGADDGVHR